jgi:uncharacterized YccA/Bax inhibitor family protein
VIGIAAFNLLLDFDLSERGVAAGAPKYMEVVRRLRLAGRSGVALHRVPSAALAASPPLN